MAKATFAPNKEGKKEVLQTEMVQEFISSIAEDKCSQANTISPKRGNEVSYRTKIYRNNAGFPHAGVYSWSRYGRSHEKKHGTLRKLFNL